MKLIYTLFFGLCLCIFAACGDQAPAEQSNAETSNATESTTNTAANGQAGLPQLPSIPVDTLKYLFDNVDYIDYIFYSEDFSLNQQDKAAIQSAISGISPQVPTLNSNCTPMGRVFWQIDGRNAAEADFYLAQGCVYYVFMKNNQPTYANLMTENGARFYINLLTSIKQGRGEQ